MNNKSGIKIDFDDILIEPKAFSDIDSRSEIMLNYTNEYLPLFTAPMDTVISKDNIEIFKRNKIHTIVPRFDCSSNVTKEETYSAKEQFIAFGIDDFIKIFINNGVLTEYDQYYILIDIANGHMLKLIDLVKKAKSMYEDRLILMVGNVANPETYEILSEAGADYIRCGIGNGVACLTTQNTGVGYPQASLISDCYQRSLRLDRPAKIISDGGIKGYADIIKALALGADYVMVGSLFNKALESAGATYLANSKKDGYTEPGDQIDQYSDDALKLFMCGTKMFKKFRGMSTKEAQKSMGKIVLKTSEGINRMQPVEYTINGWVDNFKSYLSSAMSYCNAEDLHKFIGGVNFNLISDNALNRYRK